MSSNVGNCNAKWIHLCTERIAWATCQTDHNSMYEWKRWFQNEIVIKFRFHMGKVIETNERMHHRSVSQHEGYWILCTHWPNISLKLFDNETANIMAWLYLTLSQDHFTKEFGTYSLFISYGNALNLWWKRQHVSYPCALPFQAYFATPFMQCGQRIVRKVCSISWIIYESYKESFNDFFFFFSKTMCAQIGRYSSWMMHRLFTCIHGTHTSFSTGEIRLFYTSCGESSSENWK